MSWNVYVIPNNWIDLKGNRHNTHLPCNWNTSIDGGGKAYLIWNVKSLTWLWSDPTTSVSWHEIWLWMEVSQWEQGWFSAHLKLNTSQLPIQRLVDWNPKWHYQFYCFYKFMALIVVFHCKEMIKFECVSWSFVFICCQIHTDITKNSLNLKKIMLFAYHSLGGFCFGTTT